jgi:hypothetical protein
MNSLKNVANESLWGGFKSMIYFDHLVQIFLNCLNTNLFLRTENKLLLKIVTTLCELKILQFSNITPLIYNYILRSHFQAKILDNLHVSQTSHLHHDSYSLRNHCNFLHPPVNFSISPPNISLSTIFLNSSLQLNK